MVTANQIIPEFIRALEKEIEALKAGKGGSVVKVNYGQLLREDAGLFIYLFYLENFLVTVDDAPAEIEVNGQSYKCHIVSVQGMEVQLSVEKNIGTTVGEAKLKTNLWFLLEMLRKKYEEALPHAGTLFQTSEMLFNGKSRIVSTKQNIEYSNEPNPPNESQKAAIDASFCNSLAVIWGPPGTGKTKTIAKAVEAHLRAERRVLLVSHANMAVDEALEDVAEQLKETPYYQDGKLVRLGTCHKPEIKDKFPMVFLDQITAKRGESLNREKNDLLMERDKIEKFLQEFQLFFQLEASINKLTKEREDLTNSISYIKKQIAEEKDDVRQLSSNLQINNDKLKKAQESGAIKRVFLRLNPEKIKQEIERLTNLINDQNMFIQNQEDKCIEMQSELSKKENALNGQQKQYSQKLKQLGLTKEELTEQKSTNEERMHIISSRLQEIEKALDELSKNIFSDAGLVATTLTKTFSAKQFPDRPFDVLVVDESSMVPLPYVFWAARKISSFITIVGDFLQLPPICVADNDTAKKWLGRSIFDILEINDVNRALEDKRVFPLKTQYRMNPKIADIPNEFFYGKLLEHDQGTKQKLIYDAFSNEEPLVLVDTSSFNPWCSRLSIGGRYNIYHALVSTAISRELINENKVESVGIATPYRHQARLIQKIAEDWDIGRQVRINTVHSFQGGESDVIILDCVEGPGVNHWSMLDDQRSTDNDARKLLNVALTRAKCKIYIVAHQEHLFSKLSKESIILKILDKFQRNGCVKSSAELVDSYLATDFEKWTGLALASVERINWDQTTLFNEKDFWPAFLKDILSVEDRLIIFSPFVTTARVGYFMDYFRSLVNRGVELRIYTRPPYQHGARLKEQSKIVIDQLKKIGVKVKEQKSMHQKIAIIDDKIAWEGSLNILSHRDTHEQMRRIDGQNAVKEIIRNLEIGKEERFCPECLKHGIEAEMDIRNGRYGPFWGCSRYPECLYTENVARGRRL